MNLTNIFSFRRIDDALDCMRQAQERLDNAKFNNDNAHKSLKLSLAQSGNMGLDDYLTKLRKK